jgi:hypothetical protein
MSLVAGTKMRLRHALATSDAGKGAQGKAVNIFELRSKKADLSFTMGSSRLQPPLLSREPARLEGRRVLGSRWSWAP